MPSPEPTAHYRAAHSAERRLRRRAGRYSAAEGAVSAEWWSQQPCTPRIAGHRVDGVQAHHGARARGVDHLSAAQVDADVVDRGIASRSGGIEDEVTGLERARAE